MRFSFTKTTLNKEEDEVESGSKFIPHTQKMVVIVFHILRHLFVIFHVKCDIVFIIIIETIKM